MIFLCDNKAKHTHKGLKKYKSQRSVNQSRDLKFTHFQQKLLLMASNVPNVVCGDSKYGKDVETDLGNQTRHYHYVDNAKDGEPNANAQGHVVQCPGHPAVPLCPHLVPNVAGFTG